MRKDHLRVRVCSTLVLLSLFLSAPASALGNWGLEVGRANTTDVANLAKDWNTYRRNRLLLDMDGRTILGIERQRQLLGEEFEENFSPTELFLKTEDAFLTKIMGPLQSIALNPASSCPEAQFALVTMIGLQRQQQLLGLEESKIITSVYKAIEEMVSLRCRNEALDECVATGRFRQILDLMAGTERQIQNAHAIVYETQNEIPSDEDIVTASYPRSWSGKLPVTSDYRVQVYGGNQVGGLSRAAP